MQENISIRNFLREYSIILLIFIILFLIPVLFTRINGEISWRHVFKIWRDQSLLFPLFFINHWVLVPKVLFRKKYWAYFVSISTIIGLFTFLYYINDELLHKNPLLEINALFKRPQPIPPYAHLLMYSLLLVGVDTGLLYSGRWYDTDKKQEQLEKENIKMQLNILRNQVNPHFFMNTLNNIYALIEHDSVKAREAVMQLSKLMRYILYENENERIKLSKEFELINSYINLMKIRFASEITVNLRISEDYKDVEIPPMVFLSYIENAFKYGTSYEQKSIIDINFEIKENKLFFSCTNTIFNDSQVQKGGLGMKNNDERLKLLFDTNYSLSVITESNQYKVSLRIPLS